MESFLRFLPIVLALVAAGVIALMIRPGANLRAEFDKRRLALTSGGESAVLTEKDIAQFGPGAARMKVNINGGNRQVEAIEFAPEAHSDVPGLADSHSAVRDLGTDVTIATARKSVLG